MLRLLLPFPLLPLLEMIHTKVIFNVSFFTINNFTDYSFEDVEDHMVFYIKGKKLGIFFILIYFQF